MEIIDLIMAILFLAPALVGLAAIYYILGMIALGIIREIR